MGSSLRPLGSIDAAARLLGVSRSTLARREWRDKHGVPTIRIGRSVRFDCNQLQVWISTQLERPAGCVGPPTTSAPMSEPIV